MSCGCNNKLYHLPGCPQGVTPEVNCPEGEPCDTIYPADCVIYTGPPIPCYNIATGDRVSEVLEKLIAEIFTPCSTTTTTTTQVP